MTVRPINATIDGDRVSMPRVEFERLVALLDDAEDAAAFDAAQRALASGDEELLPSALVDRLLSGESPIRVWREHRAMIGEDLAGRAGISPSRLAQIEGGHEEARIVELKALAAALRVGIEDLA